MSQTVILASDRQRHIARHLIDAAPDRAVMTIKPEKRSLDQNAKMWAMLSDVSRATPQGRAHTPEMWKALFMQACGHEIRFLHSIIDDLPFPVGFRSSEMSKRQMADLITFIEAWGTENGVKWSDQA